MRKIVSALLAALLLFSCTLVVSAAGNSFVMTATKEVEISYILSIPQAVEIDPTNTVEYNSETVIENIMQPIQIVETTGFTENSKQLNVTLNHPGKLTSEDNDEISYVIHLHSNDTGEWEIDYTDIPDGQSFKWYPDATLGVEQGGGADEEYQTKLIYEWDNAGTPTLRRASHWGVYIDVADWEAAPVGTYTATVSFTASIEDKA